MSLNKIMLIGRCTAPNIRDLESGKLATFSLATTDRYKDRAGEWKEDTTWHNIVAYGNTAGVVEKYVQKGSQIYIEGKLRNRKYTDRDGIERSVTEVLVSSMEILDRRQQNGGGSQSNQGYNDSF